MKNYTLPKEFGEKWISALRSGKYKQGRSQLKSKDGYCCLGVACKINGVLVSDLSDHEWIGKHGIKDNIGVDKIPALLHGSAYDNKFVESVSVMNDGGSSFPEIADWIEQNVELC